MTTLRNWATRCHVACRADCAVEGFAVDSRAVKPGDLFFALPGARTDGHTFLEEASVRLAAGAVVSKNYKGSSYGLPLIHVEDVLKTLQALARECLQEAKPKTIAVTGSVGKTTTKEWIYQLLGTQGHVVRSPGSCNSQIGLPLSLLQLFGLKAALPTHTTLVVEMGMTETGQVQNLVSITPPDYALLTAVSLVHAGKFSGEEEIAMAKAEVFSSPHTKIGVMPSDVTGFDRLQHIGVCTKRTFSLHDPHADYTLQQEQRKDAPYYTLKTPNGLTPLGKWHLPGTHSLHNLLAACAISCEAGLDPQAIGPVLPELFFPDKRMQQVLRKGVLFINDSFNAPPIGVEAALATLPHPEGRGRRIAVLGTMPDLGAFSQALHEKIGRLALKSVDILLCLDEETLPMHYIWQEEGRPSHHFTCKEKLSHYLNTLVMQGDVVLIKGKNTLKMWTLIEGES